MCKGLRRVLGAGAAAAGEGRAGEGEEGTGGSCEAESRGGKRAVEREVAAADDTVRTDGRGGKWENDHAVDLNPKPMIKYFSGDGGKAIMRWA